jgi:hypothetical protein
MPIQKTKFKISIKELSIEFEGDKETGHDVQQGIQQSLSNILGTQQSALTLEHQPQVIDGPIELGKPKRKRRHQSPTNNTMDGQTPKTSNGQSRPRRKGDSAGSQILVLIADSFFSQDRGLSGIRDQLALKGHNFSLPNVSAAVLPLVKDQRLIRKGNKGAYRYIKGPKA